MSSMLVLRTTASGCPSFLRRRVTNETDTGIGEGTLSGDTNPCRMTLHSHVHFKAPDAYLRRRVTRDVWPRRRLRFLHCRIRASAGSIVAAAHATMSVRAGLRIEGFGFRDLGFGFRDWGCIVAAANGERESTLLTRDSGFGFRDLGFGFRDWGCGLDRRRRRRPQRPRPAW